MAAAQSPGSGGGSGEDDLIARYFKPLAVDPGAFGLLDDAAILKGSTHDLVVTTDAIVEGVHFLPDDPPDTIARKALRVNLSDLAAKGAEPAGFVLTLALRRADHAWLAPFAQALGGDAEAFNCPLLGGDTVATPGPLMVSVTAFGRVPPQAMVRRSGARDGDAIVVTGCIGDATLGLAVLQQRLSGLSAADGEALVARYRVPQPRVGIAAAVRDHASAAMDVSDGLAGDLAKLCRASNVSADVRLADVPLSQAARAALAAKAMTLEALVTGGDDYEVLCTVPPPRLAAFRQAAESAGLAATAIGVIRSGSDPVQFVAADGAAIALNRGSYSHF
ncbi:thiamine-monophosphate kinase [Afipia sp. P52-10]|uniref:thiamine-phosphate kinase n=1 Tax=Afipia sp. P52-10 TaxID=1429916 RepID=UPI0003DF42BB|nr:thiamine-phosphate kinase [Afipia sp. P52-10]ETR75377.1 thiamine-monophosphate kinase [Afipia sp. P52-10]